MPDYDYSPVALGAPELPEGHYYKVKLQRLPYGGWVYANVTIKRERSHLWDKSICVGSWEASAYSRSDIKFAIERAARMAYLRSVAEVFAERAEGSFK